MTYAARTPSREEDPAFRGAMVHVLADPSVRRLEEALADAARAALSREERSTYAFGGARHVLSDLGGVGWRGFEAWATERARQVFVSLGESSPQALRHKVLQQGTDLLLGVGNEIERRRRIIEQTAAQADSLAGYTWTSDAREYPPTDLGDLFPMYRQDVVSIVHALAQDSSWPEVTREELCALFYPESANEIAIRQRFDDVRGLMVTGVPGGAGSLPEALSTEACPVQPQPQPQTGQSSMSDLRTLLSKAADREDDDSEYREPLVWAWDLRGGFNNPTGAIVRTNGEDEWWALRETMRIARSPELTESLRAHLEKQEAAWRERALATHPTRRRKLENMRSRATAQEDEARLEVAREKLYKHIAPRQDTATQTTPGPRARTR